MKKLLLVIVAFLMIGCQLGGEEEEKSSGSVKEITYVSDNRFLRFQDNMTVVDYSENGLETSMCQGIVYKNEILTDYFIFSAGIYDVMSGTIKGQVLTNIKSLIKELLENHHSIYPVICVTSIVPTIDINTSELNRELKIMTESLGYKYIDLSELITDDGYLKTEYRKEGEMLNFKATQVLINEINKL